MPEWVFGLQLRERCDLLATALTFRSGPLEAHRTSIFEDEDVRKIADIEGRLAVAATVSAPGSSAQHSLFAGGESCGDRLVLVPHQGSRDTIPAAYVKLELAVGDAGSFGFRLRLETFEDGTLYRGPLPIEGRLLRSANGEWVVNGGETSGRREKRPIDLEPHIATVAHALAPGQAHASFEFNTGGDIMGASIKEAGLVVVVRYADTELRQTIASCTVPSRGNALGSTDDTVLDVAFCGDLFRINADAGVVRVEREDAHRVQTTVARFPLPAPQMRAVKP